MNNIKEKWAANLKPDFPRSISQSIYKNLRQSIIEGNIKPGERIHEKDLAGVFKVSRTPVREALARLAAEGFIEISFHREVIVKEFSNRELHEAIEVIRIIDSEVIEYIVDFLKPKDLLFLEKLTSRMENFYNNREVKEYVAVNIEIHEKLWSFLPNKYVKEILLSAFGRLKRHSHLLEDLLAGPELFPRSLDSHKKLLAALKAKDKEALRTIIKVHWADAPLE